MQLVLLDEATASMDEQTDALVQETLFRELEGKTLLTIAHRLDTILNYDRILVLDQGTVKVRREAFQYGDSLTWRWPRLWNCFDGLLNFTTFMTIRFSDCAAKKLTGKLMGRWGRIIQYCKYSFANICYQRYAANRVITQYVLADIFDPLFYQFSVLLFVSYMSEYFFNFSQSTALNPCSLITSFSSNRWNLLCLICQCLSHPQPLVETAVETALSKEPWFYLCWNVQCPSTLA